MERPAIKDSSRRWMGRFKKGKKELSHCQKETLQLAKSQIDQAQKQLDLQEARVTRANPIPCQLRSK